MSLLESLAQAIDSATASLSPAVATHLQRWCTAASTVERRVEAGYSRLATFASTDAHAHATSADVRGVEQVITRVRQDDERLGHQRPERMSALLASVRERARLCSPAPPRAGSVVGEGRRVSQLPVARSPAPLWHLDQIQAFARRHQAARGPARRRVAAPADERVAAMLRALDAIVPPSDLAPRTRWSKAPRAWPSRPSDAEAAVATGAMDRAWQASSAAAGALMLLTAPGTTSRSPSPRPDGVITATSHAAPSRAHASGVPCRPGGSRPRRRPRPPREPLPSSCRRRRRRTCSGARSRIAASRSGRAIVLPDLLTRRDWYERLHSAPASGRRGC